jgi:hypothetical protein
MLVPTKTHQVRCDPRGEFCPGHDVIILASFEFPQQTLSSRLAHLLEWVDPFDPGAYCFD